eukprot:193203-Pelagomonas_calceolata.AAC.2
MRNTAHWGRFSRVPAPLEAHGRPWPSSMTALGVLIELLSFTSPFDKDHRGASQSPWSSFAIEHGTGSSH